jgi:CelD/BcsL family acetyltransferase involved in cellulose biosynthesis
MRISRRAARCELAPVPRRPTDRYLYAPAEGDIVIYGFLGYDPDYAELSPGTVLQLEAIAALMEERRFRDIRLHGRRWQHKRQFATGAVECVDLLLLRPTVRNRVLGYGLALFDAGVATLKRLLPGFFRKLARAARR